MSATMSSDDIETSREMARYLGHSIKITYRDSEGGLVEAAGLLKRVDRDTVQILVGTDLNLGDLHLPIAMNAIVSVHDYD